jgi:hypothetical protein
MRWLIGLLAVVLLAPGASAAGPCTAASPECIVGFDSSCAAMAQGPTRLARGLAYARYVSDRHGGSHKTVLVPSCGHNARCMFTADDALALVFPKD